MCGVAEKTHKNNSGLPVVYTAELHNSESGKGDIATKKIAVGRRGWFWGGVLTINKFLI